MKKIAILTGSHLSKNPRVVKEAYALSEAGYQVAIFSICNNYKLYLYDLEILNDKNIKYITIDLWRLPWFTLFYFKAVRKLYEILYVYFKIESIYSLVISFKNYLRKASFFDADLYIGHQEVGLIIGVNLQKRGKNVIFDFEDWYSEDLLPENRKKRPINLLKRNEYFALNNAVFTITTSKSMASELSKVYACSKPVVVRNVFPITSINAGERLRDDNSIIKLCWFSQTIGPGRGLETLITELNGITYDFELHLIGNISREYKEHLFNLKTQNSSYDIIIHPFQYGLSLDNLIAGFDIGFALEEKYPKNKNLTISNKIFQYLQYGNIVVASDTLGQLEIANDANGFILLADTSKKGDLKKKIYSAINLIRNSPRLKQEISNLYLEKFAWENEKSILQNKILDFFNNV